MAPNHTKVLVATLSPHVATNQAMIDKYGGSENIKKMIMTSMQEAKAAGYEITTLFVDPQDPAGSIKTLTKKLEGTSMDGLMIGYGVRGSHEYTPLFEDVVNTAKDVSPKTKFLFGNGPDDLMKTLERGFPGLMG